MQLEDLGWGRNFWASREIELEVKEQSFGSRGRAVLAPLCTSTTTSTAYASTPPPLTARARRVVPYCGVVQRKRSTGAQYGQYGSLYQTAAAPYKATAALYDGTARRRCTGAVLGSTEQYWVVWPTRRRA
eukprot:3359334-Rhodomonas_salina.1